MLDILGGQSTLTQARDRGVSTTTVANWKRRFLDTGGAALAGAPSAGEDRMLADLQAANARLRAALGEAEVLARVWRQPDARPPRLACDERRSRGTVGPMLITPRPGADRDGIITALQQAQRDASSLRGAGPSSAWSRLLTYLEWVTDAAALLQDQISGKDIDRIIQTRRYYALLESCGPLAGTVGRLAVAPAVSWLAAGT